jgi:hypothetical protein
MSQSDSDAAETATTDETGEPNPTIKRAEDITYESVGAAEGRERGS